MEECTQPICESNESSSQPVQIGFLGINGRQYDIYPGPNKIGRGSDCNIHIDLQSVSRYHAVINCIGNKTSSIMDLGATNKTKIGCKTLHPYLSYPIRNGDTVQFGDVLGIFRLFELDEDMPLTQQIDVPETPIYTGKNKPIFKCVVPASPDVSDVEESFIAASQQPVGLSENNKFVKPTGKTVVNPCVGSKNLDNSLYWNSSRTSRQFDDILNAESSNNNIHDIETQPPIPDKTKNSIYTADTQIEHHLQPTVLPMNDTECEILPNKQIKNNKSVYEAETQFFDDDHVELTKCQGINAAETQIFDNDNIELTKCQGNQDNEKSPCKNISDDEEIVFDEVESQDIYIHDSQPLLPQDNISEVVSANGVIDDNKNINCLDPFESHKYNKTTITDNISDTDRPNNKDDDDIIPSQKYFCQSSLQNDDDLTDCEDELVNLESNIKPVSNENSCDNISEIATQIIEIDSNEATLRKSQETDASKTNVDVATHTVNINMDVLTQIIDTSNIEKSTNSKVIIPINTHNKKETNAELLTQVINKNQNVFKLPFSHTKLKNIIPASSNNSSDLNPVEDDEKYYAATQQIFDDLCSQGTAGTYNNTVSDYSQDLVPDPSKRRNKNFLHSPVKSSNQDQKVVLTRNDSSGSEATPKKRIMEVELPDSQEIKLSVKPKIKEIFLSSESESEDNNEEHTPLLHRVKRRERDVKINLIKKMPPIMPTRISTRVKKPTIKMEETRKSDNILKSNFILEQESNIDQEIVADNILRLNNNIEKSHKHGDNVKKRQHKNKSQNTNKSVSKGQTQITTYMTKSESHNVNDNDTDKDITSKKNNNVKKKENEDVLCESTSDLRRKTRSSKKKSDHKNNLEKPKASQSPECKENIRRSKRYKKDNKTEDQLENVKSHSKKDRSSKHSSNTSSNIKSDSKKDSSNTRHSKDKKDKSISKEHKRDDKKSEEIPKVASKSDRSADANERRRKRKSVDEIRNFSPKRTRLAQSEKGSSSLSSLRSTPSRSASTHHILFSSFPCRDDVKLKLKKLGAILETDIKKCTVLVTNEIKRTVKLLCAIGLGKPIVGPNWIQACIDTNMIVDPWQYLIQDESSEKRFHFSLSRTLAGNRNFLKGYNVSCTPNVKRPPPEEIKLIVECSGGVWKDSPTKSQWLCVSTPIDKDFWPRYNLRGASIVTSETILCGALTQRLDLKNNLLF